MRDGRRWVAFDCCASLQQGKYCPNSKPDRMQAPPPPWDQTSRRKSWERQGCLHWRSPLWLIGIRCSNDNTETRDCPWTLMQPHFLITQIFYWFNYCFSVSFGLDFHMFHSTLVTNWISWTLHIILSIVSIWELTMVWLWLHNDWWITTLNIDFDGKELCIGPSP